MHHFMWHNSLLKWVLLRPPRLSGGGIKAERHRLIKGKVQRPLTYSHCQDLQKQLFCQSRALNAVQVYCPKHLVA